jgi:TolA-binding protein
MMKAPGQRTGAPNSCFINSKEAIMRRNSAFHAGWKWFGAVAVLLPLLTACETIMPVNSRVEQDVLEIKNKLNASLDRQAATERELSSQINSIAENQEKNSSLSVTTLDEIQRQIRTQNDELNKLRGMVEGLSIAMRDRTSPDMQRNYTPPSPNPNSLDTNPPGMTPGETTPAPPPGEAGINQVVTQATELFNNGQYAQAKEAFTQALSQNPTGDTRVEILFGLGETCNKLNDPAGAAQSYSDAILANKKNPKAWVALERLADIDIAQGNKDKAIKKLEYIANYQKYPDMARVQQKLNELKGGGASGGPAPEE